MQIKACLWQTIKSLDETAPTPAPKSCSFYKVEQHIRFIKTTICERVSQKTCGKYRLLTKNREQKLTETKKMKTTEK